MKVLALLALVGGITFRQQAEPVADDEESLGGLDDDDDLPTIELIAKDDKEFIIAKRDAMLSGYIQNQFEGDASITSVPLKGAPPAHLGAPSGRTLELIVEYLQHHEGKQTADIEKPVRSTDMKDIVEDKWDADFVDGRTDTKMAFPLDTLNVMESANYMDVRPLLHLTAAKIATMIKGKSPEEIKAVLGGLEQKSE